MMLSRKVILTDIDATILDFNHGFALFMEQRGFFRRPNMERDYALAPQFGLNERQVLAMIEEFFDSPAATMLRPEPCAARVLPRLHQRGYRFVAITASPKTARKKRMANIERVFGFQFTDVHCVGFHGDKTPVLRQYFGHAHCWVDDHPEHVFNGAMVGHHSLLIERPWNQEDRRMPFIRVPDWHDIARRLPPP